MAAVEKTNDNEIPDGVKIPDEFSRIIEDFINDIKNTFPEYIGIINRWWKPENNEKQIINVFKHCTKIIPERFFDILYKNNDIFSENSEVNTEFLPGIVFKHLWTCDISEKTRETIWKYLQLILFSVIGSLQNKSQLGDTAKLFEAINEDELKSKLQETLEGMQSLFNNPDLNTETESKEPSMPSAEDIHHHIHGMMEGKLGKLAMELAEETAEELNMDMENVTNTQDVFQKLLSNPTKLMNMVKNVGGKIDEKIKSGEIKESELITEGVELLNRMKGMPGMENMKDMFSKMGIHGLGKDAKLNTAAMEAKLNQNLKLAQMKERIKANANKKKQSVSVPETAPAYTEEEIISIFSTGEKVDKTPRGAKPKQGDKKKKKK
jgi:hypothetical protein